jgi:hypothetical protein
MQAVFRAGLAGKNGVDGGPLAVGSRTLGQNPQLRRAPRVYDARKGLGISGSRGACSRFVRSLRGEPDGFGGLRAEWRPEVVGPDVAR